MELPPSKAAEDVGFSLDVLARFYEELRARTRRALIAVGGRADQVDAPNLAAEAVPVYRDEVIGLAHLLAGHAMEESEARVLAYEHAFACIAKELAPDRR